MKFICLTLLLVSGITDSKSAERFEVVGPADPVFAVAGEDVILPCSVTPNISVVEMRVEWFRADQKDLQLVHLYDNHEDRNTDQIQSYRGRTKLTHQELLKGNASLKLSTVRVSDEGLYKCFIQSKSQSDDATVNVRVEAIGSPPVITVDGFDHSGGLHLQCESEGWYPEPVLEWLDSEGVSLSSETTETHRNMDRYNVKHTITVHHSNDKIHCRVKLRHHMLEALIITTNNMFISWRTSVVLISAAVVLIVIAGILIAMFVHKNRALNYRMRRAEYIFQMKFICLTLLLVSGIADSRSAERFEVVGPADPVFAVAGEDVILPCSVTPNISVEDMRVEWFRADQKDLQLVHLYDNHEDRNTNQIQSYRGRTKLAHQELLRGNASLKLSTVRVSDEGLYKCFIQSKSQSDDATVNVRVEAIGSPPVITVDGFDHSGGLHLQCESEGWYPEPVLEWLDSEGVSLSSETTETHRNMDRYNVKHTITVHHSNDKIHCRVKLRHHMLEALIITTNNMFISWRTSVILISVAVVLIVITGAVFAYKYRERDQLLQSQKIILPKALTHLRKHTAVKVILDADTAHPRLGVSDDGKQVRNENRDLNGVDWEEDRFAYDLAVLGKDGFSSGSFYFEVQVKDQTLWDLGVARESSDRKSRINLSPERGYWIVGRRDKKYRARDSPSDTFSVRVEPQRVGVLVNYEEGSVSFYDVESMSHIYSYTGQCFNEKLYPFIGLGYRHNNNTTPLIICDDY
ncbi:butyrophilin-like protein 3 [Pseudorasbora parva]|uniref:butyrophilin-like protein 3 n=1 Tax=Pseudorasbora parva TaxID=51549 RepID=UPI00351E58D3